MEIRCFSDLHWEIDFNKQHQTRHASDPYPEFWSPVELESDKDTILILAGDLYYGLESIPNIKVFSDRFKQVLVVLGNHDYWCKSIYGPQYSLSTLDIDYETELISQEMNNVKLIHNNTFEIDDYIFVGGTLWTDIDKSDPFLVMNADRYMKPDFAYIDGMTPNSWLSHNKKTFEYIKIITEQNKDKKIVVITHHSPSYKSVSPRFVGDDANAYFTSDYSEFILDNENIIFWQHGHMHNNSDYMIGNARVVCNPRGYSTHENPEFSEESIYKI